VEQCGWKAHRSIAKALRNLILGDRGGAAITPLRFLRGVEGHPAPLRAALQPATAVVSPGQQDALADDEGLAQDEAELSRKQPCYLTGCDG